MLGSAGFGDGVENFAWPSEVQLLVLYIITNTGPG